MRKRVYVSGPMTGLPDLNRKEFMEAEQLIREHGCKPVNPARIGQRHGWTWADYMLSSLNMMLKCDEVVLLPGWRESKGVQVEIDLAQRLGMPVVELAEFCRQQVRAQRARIDKQAAFAELVFDLLPVVVLVMIVVAILTAHGCCYVRMLMRDERAVMSGIPSIDAGIYPDPHVEEVEDGERRN